MKKRPLKIKKVDGMTHAETLQELHDASFGESAPLPEWGGEHRHWWLVYDGDKAVAFAGLWTKRTAFLSRVGVLPLYRGRSLQRRLIRVRVNLARKMKYKYAISYTINNAPSASNLIREGFLPYTPRSNWSSAKCTTYWWKDL